MAEYIPSPESTPDLMNDPRYATNNTDSEEGGGEPDTCRICRTEGDGTESLFHPCKCSGSIKYVHQDCLMEWLSHSQKKHCELCKTPFRFTKLYSPNMPQTLPFHLLVRHVFMHSLKNLGTWLRFGLVVFVWLGCLPYIIRQVWKLLFWFSDGGWPTHFLGTPADHTSLSDGRIEKLFGDFFQDHAVPNATSPVSPLLAAQTTPAYLGGLVKNLTDVVSPLAPLLGANGSDPLMAGFFRVMLTAFGARNIQVIPDIYGQNASLHSQQARYSQSTSTLLSEVSYLQNFTRFPYLNHMVISIVEGYVITISVVVSFILVFLIREWVVQQQPGINVGAGFNADIVQNERNQVIEPVNHAPEVRDQRQRVGVRPRRHNALENEGVRGLPVQATGFDQQADATMQNRPAPVRDALSPAAEIQRRLTEEPRFTEDFLAIWRRSEGNPDEVLRIIEAEQKTEQMSYWVNSMKILQRTLHESPSEMQSSAWLEGDTAESSNIQQLEDTSSITSSIESNTEAQPVANNVGLMFSETRTNTPHNDSQPSITGQTIPNSGHSKKGKERAIDESHNPSLPTIFSSSSGTRPRSISDGPHPSQSISPLATGTWTFNNLPNTANDLELKLPSERRNQPHHDSNASEISSPPLNNLRTYEAWSPTSDDHEIWKQEQDLLVKRAVEKGKELRRNSLPRTESQYSPQIGASLSDLTEFSETSASGVIPPVVEAEEASRFDNTTNDQHHDRIEADLGHQDIPASLRRPPVPAVAAEPRGLFVSVADFFWGGEGEDTDRLEEDHNDQHIVQDLNAEPPFVPVLHHDAFDEEDEELPQGPEVGDAPMADIDLNDPDGVDDAEDFDGIMELVGMRGPMFSLLQNAIFSAFLLSLTVAIGIWIPYNIGRITLLLVANPSNAFKVPLKLIFGSAAFVQDLALSFLGLSTYAFTLLFSLPFHLLDTLFTTNIGSKAAQFKDAALYLSEESFYRVSNGTIEALIHVGDSDIFAFSAASHESLIHLRSLAQTAISAIGSVLSTIGTTRATGNLTKAGQLFQFMCKNAFAILQTIPGVLVKPETWVISLEIPKRSEPLDLALSVWSGTDRFWAVVAGYTTVSVAGALYVRKGTPFSTSQVGREWEDIIIDLLNQAGGVFKVILIISIEMLVFPLYCGLLLDVALLPLFENATIMSRMLFTYQTPLTSIFVHWFIGTCYMFHFALFVSMCRKIMRKGVLYFIRDPDDPTFHPVRDVLERNIATQLRKILFSALVYGALVIVCLGGVVWSLALAFNGVLPIHWSSNEPVLEFPVDLLFYNFVMPLAVRFFKPSDVLHSIYTWWFRKCARMLRLTWFMFDERQKDEEGYHVQKTWGHVLRFSKGDPDDYRTDQDLVAPFEENPELQAYFHRDGRYVRAPASDQVRIPKGQKIFLEVDENNKRIDGLPDSPDGMHGSSNSLYKHLYVPPWFRVRIFTFILSIWLFAAFTGVSVTIVPLVFGRHVFTKIIPPHVHKNDVYAFSMGIYILGSALYAMLHLRTFYNYVKRSIGTTFATRDGMLQRAATITIRLANFTWTYTAFLLILPALFAACVELYFIVPLHSYMAIDEKHVVHFVQSWTLGLLYVKLTTRLILWFDGSRQAQTLQAITRDGYLNPDGRLATRCFILPLGSVLAIALSMPWALATSITATVLKDRPESHTLAFRYSYPLFLCFGVVLFALYLLLGMLRRWQMLIRDEVYLIGERLHNFGERKSTSVSTGGPPNMRRIET